MEMMKNAVNWAEIPVKAGGKIIVPKTQITPDLGYFAMFEDSEGNNMALHSMN